MNKFEKRAEDNHARMFVLYGQIGAKLREMGHETGMSYRVDGIWNPLDITVDSPDYRRHKKDGDEDKLRIQIRTPFGKKQFPQRKKGWDIDAICKFVSEEINRQKVDDTREQQRRKNDKKYTAMLLKVAAELGLDASMGQVYGPLAVRATPQGVRVTLTVHDIQNEWDLKDVILKMQGTGLIK